MEAFSMFPHKHIRESVQTRKIDVVDQTCLIDWKIVGINIWKFLVLVSIDSTNNSFF